MIKHRIPKLLVVLGALYKLSYVGLAMMVFGWIASFLIDDPLGYRTAVFGLWVGTIGVLARIVEALMRSTR